MAILGLDQLIASINGGKFRKGLYQKTTVNGAASAAGRWHEFFTATGIPAAGTFSGTAGVATVMNGATVGSLDVGQNVVTPDFKNLLNLKAQSPTSTIVPLTLYLMDYLLYYPSCVVTTGAGTTLNNTVTLPRSNTGDNVVLMAAVQTALGATQPALTISYTDEAGNTGNTGGLLTAPAASAPISTLLLNNGSPFMPFAAGDRGIRRVDSYTVATGTTGTISLILAKVIAEIDVYAINTGVRVDYLAQVPSLPRIDDNACLGFIGCPGGAMGTGSVFSGTIDAAWG